MPNTDPEPDPESFPGERAACTATESQRRLVRAAVTTAVEQQRLAGATGLLFWRLAGAPLAGATRSAAARDDDVSAGAPRGVEDVVEATSAEVETALDEFDAFLATYEPDL